MLTAPKPEIFSDAVRLKAPPMLTLVPPLPPREEPKVPVYEQVLRPTLRIPPEELEDFESMWDVPARSW
jgi:hypothetical protein